MIIKIKSNKVLLLKNSDGYLQHLKEIRIPGMIEAPEVSTAKIIHLLKSVKAYNEEVHIIPDEYRVSMVEVVPTKKDIQNVSTAMEDEICLYDVQKGNSVIMYNLHESYQYLMDELVGQSLEPKIYPNARVAQAVLSKINYRTASVAVEPDFVEFTVVEDSILYTKRMNTGLSKYIQNIEGCNDTEVDEILKSYRDGTKDTPVRVEKILASIQDELSYVKEKFLPYAIAIVGPLSKAIEFEDSQEFPLVKVNPGGEWMEGLPEMTIQELNPLLFPIIEFEMGKVDRKKGKKKSAAEPEDEVEEEVNEDDSFGFEGVGNEIRIVQLGGDISENDQEISEDEMYEEEIDYEEEFEEELEEEPVRSKRNTRGKVDKRAQKKENPKKEKGKSLFGKKKNMEVEELDEISEGDYDELFEPQEEKPKGRNRDRGRGRDHGKKDSKNVKNSKSKGGKIGSKNVVIWSLIGSIIILAGSAFYLLDPMGLFTQETAPVEQSYEETTPMNNDQKVSDITALKEQFGFEITNAYENIIDEKPALTVELANVKEADLEQIKTTLESRYITTISEIETGISITIV